MTLKLPKVGDPFFTLFESDYVPGESQIFPIAEVDDSQAIEDGEHEGRSVYISEEGCWYDCFWSERHQIFVYGLEGGA